MNVTISTKIDKYTSSSLGNRTILNNVFIGRDQATIDPQGQEMLVDQADTKEWILDSTSGPAFTQDLLTLIKTTATDKVKFIHIQCYKVIDGASDINAPIRFSLSWGATSMGKMSQFQVANADSINPANLTVSNIEVSDTDRARLEVMFALKQ